MNVREINNILELAIIGVVYQFKNQNEKINRQYVSYYLTTFIKKYLSDKGVREWRVTCDETNNPLEIITMRPPKLINVCIHYREGPFISAIHTVHFPLNNRFDNREKCMYYISMDNSEMEPFIKNMVYNNVEE